MGNLGKPWGQSREDTWKTYGILRGLGGMGRKTKALRSLCILPTFASSAALKPSRLGTVKSTVRTHKYLDEMFH